MIYRGHHQIFIAGWAGELALTWFRNLKKVGGVQGLGTGLRGFEAASCAQEERQAGAQDLGNYTIWVTGELFIFAV